VNSPALACLVRKEEGIRPERILTITNFLDESAFFPLGAAERRRIREEMAVPAEATVVGAVANLTPVKDLGILIRAAAELHERHPDVYFVLLGEGDRRRELEGLVSQLGLEGRIRLPGQWIRPWNLHAAFDISVLCSKAEGFPNSIVEAMAAGNPVVATEVGGTVDAIAHEQNGLLVPPGDPGALALALDRALRDPPFAQRLGEKGRQRAEEKFAASRVLPRLENSYEALVRTGSLPCGSLDGQPCAE
jgi:glycosyltransferase involved in cell wall biosynthesis